MAEPEFYYFFYVFLFILQFVFDNVYLFFHRMFDWELSHCIEMSKIFKPFAINLLFLHSLL